MAADTSKPTFHVCVSNSVDFLVLPFNSVGLEWNKGYKFCLSKTSVLEIKEPYLASNVVK